MPYNKTFWAALRAGGLGLMLLLLALIAAPHARAAETGREQAIWQQAGGEAILGSLDKDARHLLEQAGGADLFQDGLSGSRLFDALSRLVRDKLTAPLKACGALAGMVVLCCLARCLDAAPQGALSMVEALCCALVVLPHMLTIITACGRAAQSASALLLASIPVYGALLAVGNGAASSGGYTFLTLGLGSAVPLLSSGVILPLLRAFLALSVSAGASGAKVQTLTKSLYSLLKWLLVLGVTLFSGVLSVQTILNTHMDAAANKTAKLLASSAIPIVGGALGDALGAIQGSVQVVKAGAGAFGMLAALCVFAPTLIEAALWVGVCTVGQLAADICGAGAAGNLLSACAAGAKLVLAVLCSLCAVSVACAGVLLFAKG